MNFLRDLYKRDPLLLPLLLILLVYLYLVFNITVEDSAYRIERIDQVVLLLGALITITAFLLDRRESLVSRRTEIQREFFNKWQELRAEIDNLKDETDILKVEKAFIRYFELLNFEFSMSKHINPAVFKEWRYFRRVEFGSMEKYAGLTFKEWWQRVNHRFPGLEFKKSLDKL